MRRISRLIGIALVAALASCRGQHEGPGEVTRKKVPDAVLAERRTAQAAAGVAKGEGIAAAAGAEKREKQILFGDLHVHTTISADAFLRSLPMLQGEGAHPPADACDFARF